MGRRVVTALEIQAEGDLPIRDTDSLQARLHTAVSRDPEAEARLTELWYANGLNGIDPLVTTEAYRKMERLVATVETSITGPDAWARYVEIAEQITGLPAKIYAACSEALDVCCDLPPSSANAGGPLVTTDGRLAEAERIVAEAVAYAASLEPEPTLEPIAEPTQAEVAETMTDYPGPKAKADEVLAWVGQDRNRAARAWMHEHADRKPRKGVTEKLADVLGEGGVLAVQTAMEAAEPPPLDLSAPPSPRPESDEGGEPAPVVGAGAQAEREQPTGESVEEFPPLDVEPPAPNIDPAEPDTRRDALVLAFRNVGVAMIELATALEEAV